MTTKSCNTCRETKPLDKFHLSKAGRQGRNNDCKQSRSEKRRALDFPRPESGTHLCPRCEIEKDVKDFSADKSSSTGLQTYCKQCQKEMGVEYKIKNDNFETYISFLFKDLKNNAKSRKLAVKIVKEDIAALYNKQEGKCALTGQHMTYNCKIGEGRGSERTSKNISVDAIGSIQLNGT